jgi:hypothetical protein
MSIRNLTPQVRVIRGGAPVAAGTGDTQTFTEIDTRGFEAVRILVVLGAITASGVATLRAKGSNTTGTYGAGTVDLIQDNSGNTPVTASAQLTTGDSNKVLSLEIYRPNRRFIRPEVVRQTANVVIEAIIVELISPINTIRTIATADGAGALVSNPTYSAA